MMNSKFYRTKNGFFIKHTKSGTFVFSPNTGQIYGVNNEDSDAVIKWLEDGNIDIDTIYYGIKGLRNDSEARLYPNLSAWENVVFPKEPLLINWLISNTCTHDCTYCYASDLMRAEHHNQVLSEESIKTTIKAILSYHPLAVVLTGGEPFMNPDLLKIIKLLKNKVGIIIDTNGCLVEDEHLEVIRENMITLRISLDSLRPKENEKLRKTKLKNSTVRTVATIEKSLKLGITTIVHTVATQNNINDLVPIGDYFAAAGLKHWRILRVVSEDKNLGYTDKKYIHFYNQLIKRYENMWMKHMGLEVQNNRKENLNSVILVTFDGDFITESPITSGKILVDDKHPKEPECFDKINWWTHYGRYLNF